MSDELKSTPLTVELLQHARDLIEKQDRLICNNNYVRIGRYQVPNGLAYKLLVKAEKESRDISDVLDECYNNQD